jgi:dsRNA-specific ribonuclease
MNIASQLVDGVNYDLETLEYITPGVVADKICMFIIDQMKKINVHKFVLYDICGCIGGSTMSFLSEKDTIPLVITYEADEKWSKMLKRNINVYNFGSRSLIYNQFFNASTPVVKGAALFFDPPWLLNSQHVDIVHHPYDQYIRSGIKLGDASLEQILSSLKTTYIVVFHVPPMYELEKVDGWEYDAQHIKSYDGTRVKRTLYICTQESAIKETQKRQGGLDKFIGMDMKSHTTDAWVDPDTVKPVISAPSLSSLLPKSFTGPTIAVNSLVTPQPNTGLSIGVNSLVTPQPFVAPVRHTIGVNSLVTPQPFAAPVRHTIGVNSLVTAQPFEAPVGATIGVNSLGFQGGPSSFISPVTVNSSTIGFNSQKGNSLIASTFNDGPSGISQTGISVPKIFDVKVSKTEIVSSTEDSRSKEYTKLIESLPRYSKDSSQWLGELRRYISCLLTSVIDDNDLIILMVSADAMRIWARAFTHSNWNAKENYEALETLGDGSLKYLFRKYLLREQKDITPAMLSNFETYYMSKMFQAKISNELQLPDWIRIQGNLTISIIEDLFESLFGAIDAVWDVVFNSGYIIPPKFYNGIGARFLGFIFKDHIFDSKRALGNPKTLLLQTSTRLYWDKYSTNGKGVYTTSNTDKDDNETVSINFSSYTLEFLKNVDVEITNPIGQATSNTKKGAEAMAYHLAYDKLYVSGFTQDVVDKLRAILDLETVENSSNKDAKLVVQNAKTKALKEYESKDLRFHIDRSTVDKKSIQVDLRVYKDDGSFVSINNVNAKNNSTSQDYVKIKLWYRSLKLFVDA